MIGYTLMNQKKILVVAINNVVETAQSLLCDECKAHSLCVSMDRTVVQAQYSHCCSYSNFILLNNKLEWYRLNNLALWQKEAFDTLCIYSPSIYPQQIYLTGFTNQTMHKLMRQKNIESSIEMSDKLRNYSREKNEKGFFHSTSLSCTATYSQLFTMNHYKYVSFNRIKFHMKCIKTWKTLRE